MTTRQRPTRRGWLMAAGGTALGLAIAGVAVFSTAFAVHNPPYPFELDGNITDNSGNSQQDWQTVFGLNTVIPPATGTPVVTGAAVFIHDLPTGNAKETQYDAGKDIYDTSAWTRKDVTKVVPDKDNILDAFAKQYMVDVGGGVIHRVIYFGADRLANNGDATMSFWFFQKKVELTGTNGFSPAHTARNVATGQRGDILIQVDFLNGGSESRLRAFEWVGSGGSDGSLDLLRPPADVNGATVCLTDDTACATTNNAATPSYWPYIPKAGSSGIFPAESLFEGGIDLTALVGDVCLNSFLASTRSSQQTTSDLKDLALGDFNTCGHIDLVRKECKAQTDVSPVYNPGTELYTTRHDLTIRNDGLGGNVFDVAVRDDAVGGDNNCRIVAIGGAGVTGAPTIPLPAGLPFPNNTTFIKVADSLAAGIDNQMMVTLVCTSPDNPFTNSASVRAAQQSGGSASLTDNYIEVADDTSSCNVTVPTGLELTKSCPKAAVVLDASNGYKPKVCVDITLKNTGGSKIDITKLIDKHGTETTGTSLLSQLESTTIDPGVTVNGITDCYTPTAPDSGQTDPDLAGYTDTVSASGHPHTAAAGVTVDATDKSATCLLCPGPGS